MCKAWWSRDWLLEKKLVECVHVNSVRWAKLYTSICTIIEERERVLCGTDSVLSMIMMKKNTIEWKSLKTIDRSTLLGVQRWVIFVELVKKNSLSFFFQIDRILFASLICADYYSRSCSCNNPIDWYTVYYTHRQTDQVLLVYEHCVYFSIERSLSHRYSMCILLNTQSYRTSVSYES